MASELVTSSIRLPAKFVATHQTDGLPGYPAIDVFGSPGALVVAGFWGRVRKLSGHPCADGGVPHGAYGRSVYVYNRLNRRDRFCTHMDKVFVKEGQFVKPGTVLGTICDSAVSHNPGSSHVHLGFGRQ